MEGSAGSGPDRETSLFGEMLRPGAPATNPRRAIGATTQSRGVSLPTGSRPTFEIWRRSRPSRRRVADSCSRPTRFRMCFSTGSPSMTNEMAEAGYEGEELKRKLGESYRRHRPQRGRMLFLLSLESRDREEFHFLQKALEKQISLRSSRRHTFSLEENSKPKVENWSVYEYPPNSPRRYKPRVPLGRIDSVQAELTAGIDPEKIAPIELTVSGIIATRRTQDPANSINVSKRQISCVFWKDLTLAPLEIRFFPGRWNAPNPPRLLLELIDAVD